MGQWRGCKTDTEGWIGGLLCLFSKKLKHNDTIYYKTFYIPSSKTQKSRSLSNITFNYEKYIHVNDAKRMRAVEIGLLFSIMISSCNYPAAAKIHTETSGGGTRGGFHSVK